MKKLSLIVLSLGLLALAACGGAEESDTAAANSENPGGKTDTPEGDDTPENQCAKREQDVIHSAQPTFTPTAIRWACSDVEGVTTVGRDDRGQEYCEYYAAVQLDPAQPSVELGRPLDGGGVTPLPLELNDDQLAALEDEPDKVVGACVFTSWHADIEDKYASCADDKCDNVKIMGQPLNAEHFRMKVSFNSNSAASDLVAQCLNPRNTPVADENDPNDPLHKDFYRACIKTSKLYGTHWRRSDPAVCAASQRLLECGCSLPNNADVPTSLVPPREAQGETLTLRGFPLGTWSDAKGLPTGCRYADTGEQGQNLVLCDLTANDLLASLDDPKGTCRAKYGDNVVVHVPIPPNVITCDPSKGLEPYNKDCSDMPWVVTE